MTFSIGITFKWDDTNGLYFLYWLHWYFRRFDHRNHHFLKNCNTKECNNAFITPKKNNWLASSDLNLGIHTYTICVEYLTSKLFDSTLFLFAGIQFCLKHLKGKTFYNKHPSKLNFWTLFFACCYLHTLSVSLSLFKL